MLAKFKNKIVWSSTPVTRIAELMSYYRARKKHHCKICESLQDISRQFQERSPVTVAFSLNIMNTPIDPRINFAGSVYSIFAVVYSDGNHFIARIRIDHTVYEYDGMVRRGLFQNPNPLTNRIKTPRGNDYNAQMVWYRIVDSKFNFFFRSKLNFRYHPYFQLVSK
jgi:hypothetical protein